jgi:peptidoglycan/LPS O-acetylase OafA/YrhL
LQAAVAVEAERSHNPPMTEIKGLSGIRGWAALWVALFHFAYVNSDAQHFGALTNFVQQAYHALPVFFVLSGFLLAHVYGRQLAEGRISVGRFMVLRLARIYPLYILVLVAFAVLVGLGYLKAGPHDTPYTFALNVMLVQTWGLVDGFTWNIVGWTLSIEFAAYLLFPLVGPWVLRHSARWATGAILVVLALLAGSVSSRIILGAAGALGLPTDVHFAYGLYLPPHLLFFFAGVCLYRVLLDLRTGGWQFDVAVAAGLLWLTLGAGLGGVPPWAILASSLLVVLGCCAPGGLGERLFGNRASAWLGEVSFAFYLVHWPMIYVWIHMLPEGVYWQHVPMWERFGVALALAAVLHHGVEKPLLEVLRRWLRRPTVLPSAPPHALPAARTAP